MTKQNKTKTKMKMNKRITADETQVTVAVNVARLFKIKNIQIFNNNNGLDKDLNN